MYVLDRMWPSKLTSNVKKFLSQHRKRTHAGIDKDKTDVVKSIVGIGRVVRMKII